MSTPLTFWMSGSTGRNRQSPTDGGPGTGTAVGSPATVFVAMLGTTAAASRATPSTSAPALRSIRAAYDGSAPTLPTTMHSAPRRALVH